MAMFVVKSIHIQINGQVYESITYERSYCPIMWFTE